MNFSLQQAPQESAPSGTVPELPPLQRTSRGRAPSSSPSPSPAPKPRGRGSRLGRRLALLTILVAVVGTAGYFGLAATGSAGGSTLSTLPGLSKWLGPTAPTVLVHPATRGPLSI